jgi:hypothetical protein
MATYSSAVYFIVTTFTTVGYGDFYGSTMQERLFLFAAQFIGIMIFAVLQGLTHQLITIPQLEDIITEKVDDI